MDFLSNMLGVLLFTNLTLVSIIYPWCFSKKHYVTAAIFTMAAFAILIASLMTQYSFIYSASTSMLMIGICLVAGFDMARREKAR